MLPAEKHQEFRDLWADQTASTGYIREYFGVSWSVVQATRAHLGLPERANRTTFVWAPTEDEIVERAAQCRAKWSDQVRESHATARTARVRADVKRFTFDRKTMSFS